MPTQPTPGLPLRGPGPVGSRFAVAAPHSREAQQAFGKHKTSSKCRCSARSVTPAVTPAEYVYEWADAQRWNLKKLGCCLPPSLASWEMVDYTLLNAAAFFLCQPSWQRPRGQEICKLAIPALKSSIKCLMDFLYTILCTILLVEKRIGPNSPALWSSLQPGCGRWLMQADGNVHTDSRDTGPEGASYLPRMHLLTLCAPSIFCRQVLPGDRLGWVLVFGFLSCVFSKIVWVTDPSCVQHEPLLLDARKNPACFLGKCVVQVVFCCHHCAT